MPPPPPLLVALLTVKPRLAVLVKVPDFPVTMVVVDPTTAVELAVSVNVDVTGLVLFTGIVTVAGLKVAVTPTGRPAMVKATDPVKPFCPDTETTVFAVLPLTMVKAAGLRLKLKLGMAAGGFTVRETVTDAVSEPDFPKIVIVDGPVVAVELAFNVKTLLVVDEAGLKDAVTPLGRPVAEKVTTPEIELTFTVEVTLPPRSTVVVFGLAVRLNDDCAAVPVMFRMTFKEKLPVEEYPTTYIAVV